MLRHRLPLSQLALLSLTLIGATLLAPSIVNADIYKYVDEDGTVHFTNAPRRDPRYRLYLRSRDGRHGTPGGTGAAFRPGPERSTQYDDVVREACTLYQIPEALVWAVIKVESGFDPRAISHAGAAGLMQLMPETAQRMQVQDILDPRQNILGGVRYLRILANMFNGDLQLTLAAYNAGENAVVRYAGIPPYEETQDYVVRVLEYYRRYRETPAPTEAPASPPAQ